MDISKLLKNREGVKVYSTIYGYLIFRGYDCGRLEFRMPDKPYNHIYSFYPNGKYNENGECVLFPSESQRNWDEFNPPAIKYYNMYHIPKEVKLLVRDDLDDKWKIAYNPAITTESDGKDYITARNDKMGYCTWKQAIPYNEETKQLHKTKKEPSEYYQWWKNHKY